MKKAKEILIPAISLFIICLVSTFLLGGTNLLTEDKIAEVAEKSAQEARLAVCPGAVSFNEKEVTTDSGTYTVFEGLDKENKTVGYAVTANDKSYGGEIQVMTGFDSGLKITGVEILSIDDTPGLGMNAKKEEFRGQFSSKTGELTVSKQASAENEIQALTGATITSKAVTRCVNAAYAAVSNMGGEN